ncbi:unnamed protein product [Brachionus calyciflorus]|uniref:Caveolin n=1 Tax=Brachionus calyciflorus TaxID=104777 RepID=A0A814KXE2_9BILA|nr:unnamed protein product [Brachionus calyciflorus]
MSEKLEIDLIRRDPHEMNNYLQVEFDDVFAEPTGTHSADCVWRNSFKCFTCGKNVCYKLLTFFCGICISLAWGCAFAQISFSVIWCFAPYLRALHVVLFPFKKIYSIILASFCGPLFETCGLVLSRIHVTQSQGPPPRPIDAIEGDENQRPGRLESVEKCRYYPNYNTEFEDRTELETT